MKVIFDISPFNWPELFRATIAGSIIRFERQPSGKPVGVRASILICIGTCVFTTYCSINKGLSLDLRIIGQIITGIGFLGAGVTLTRDGIVMGVTPAACIWILAAIGITIGTHHHVTSIKLSILTVDTAEKKIDFLRKGLQKEYSKGQN